MNRKGVIKTEERQADACLYGYCSPQTVLALDVAQAHSVTGFP